MTPTPATEEKRLPPTASQWYLFDAKDQVLGRLSTKVAMLLIGKGSPDYAPNVAALVNVVVINSDHVVLTGKKETQKMYRHYTGYPGGLKERSVRDQRSRDSRRIIEAAIFGMLPKNNLRKVRMQHLLIYPTQQHPHLAQINQVTTEKV